MKKLTPSHVLFTIVPFVSLIFKSTFTMAQTCFIDPANPETACSCTNSASNVTHSGNDCRYPIFYPNDLGYVIVNVYDGDYPGISLEDPNNPFMSCIALPSDITDPDVALVEGEDPVLGIIYWYAIVVYELNGNCYWDVYEYDPNLLTFSQKIGYPQILQSCNGNSTYKTAINVDADALSGNFVIVWDDASEARILAQGGYAYASPPGLNGIAVVVNDDQYVMPDVSLSSRGSIGGNYRTQVYISYVDNSINKVYVDGGYYENWISSNTCTTTNVNFTQEVIGPPTGHQGLFLYPRIACPNYLVTSAYTDWALVAELYYAGGNIDDIFGYTFQSSPSSFIYTDGGTNSFCDINDERNQFPVVSYDYSNDGFVVSWESSYSSDAVFLPNGIASIYCDPSGSLNTTCGYYQVVSLNNQYNSAYMNSPSLSGRDMTSGDPLLYTWYDKNNNVGDVVYKTDPWLTCNLRKKSEFNHLKYELNDVNNYQVIIFNSLGVKLSDLIVKGTEIKDLIYKTQESHPSQLYFVNIIGIDDQINYSIKVLNRF